MTRLKIAKSGYSECPVRDFQEEPRNSEAFTKCSRNLIHMLTLFLFVSNGRLKKIGIVQHTTKLLPFLNYFVGHATNLFFTVRELQCLQTEILLTKNIIEPVQTRYSALSVLTLMKNRSFHFCVSFKSLGCAA